MNKSYLEHKNDHDFFSKEHIQNFLRFHKTGVDNKGRQKLGEIIKECGYSSILDAPSGSAVNYEVFKLMDLKIKEYLAFDLTQELLDEAKRRYGNSIITCKGYLQEIDKYLGENSMECVISRHIFEHLPPGDMESVIEKLFKIAKKELILVFFLDLSNGSEHIYEERSSNIEGHPEVTHYWNSYSHNKFMSFLSKFNSKIEKYYMETPGAAAADTIFRIIK